MRDPRYLEGVRCFNRGEWFEAHEVLEDLWREDQGPTRSYWQGLIQAAVALEHWRRGNPRGARSQWGQAQAHLVRYAPHHEGLDVAAFIAAMEACMGPLMDDDGAELDIARVPELRLG
ncbi:MAG: DUF309 domain-containing protein [Euryarchaeota archaeon]|nr:DUF309 domain-containing protein [Euryarchaeota archaeon]